MLDYLIGSLLLIVGAVFFYMLGTCLTKSNTSLPKNILTGYLIYSFFSALVLMLVQFLNLQWKIAYIYTIILIILLLLFIIIQTKKNNIKYIDDSVMNMIHQYFFLFVLALILFVIYLLQFDLLWINNHLDDGYYLIKAATLPYESTPFSVTYASGLSETISKFNTYLISTFELEASVFIHLFKMDASIYLKYVVNTFNYFLAICSVYCIGEKMVKASEIKMSKYVFQFFPMVLLIFTFNDHVIQKLGFLVVQDSWQFNTAMWYGSSIVRVMGILWIILPFIEKNKITIKELIQVAAICFVLMSKSPIALPVIFLAGIAYLIAFFITSETKLMKMLGVFLTITVVLVGIIFPNLPQINQAVFDVFALNRYSVLIWGSVIVLLIYFMKYPSKVNLRFLIILFVCFVLMIFPEINDSFEFFSMYEFVAKRAQTTWFYTMVSMAFISLCILLYQKYIRIYRWIQSALLCLLLVGTVVTNAWVYGNPLSTLKVMAVNYHLLPNSTVELSHALEQIPIDEINVLMPEWVLDHDHNHSLAVIARVYAPHIHSISAIPRFGVTEGNDFSDFTSEDQKKYDAFREQPNQETYQMLKDVLTRFPINVLVFQNYEFDTYADDLNFSFYEQTNNGYVIYVKENR